MLSIGDLILLSGNVNLDTKFEYLLHHGHGILEATSVLRGLGDTHGGLEKNLDGTLGHIVVAIEFLVALFTHLFHHRARIGIKEIDEALEYV